MANIHLTNINTDVLVIGGGIAGVFAAVNAAWQGVRVVMVDKGMLVCPG